LAYQINWKTNWENVINYQAIKAWSRLFILCLEDLMPFFFKWIVIVIQKHTHLLNLCSVPSRCQSLLQMLATSQYSKKWLLNRNKTHWEPQEGQCVVARGKYMKRWLLSTWKILSSQKVADIIATWIVSWMGGNNYWLNSKWIYIIYSKLER
jgi:hypothetical protein